MSLRNNLRWAARVFLGGAGDGTAESEGTGVGRKVTEGALVEGAPVGRKAAEGEGVGAALGAGVGLTVGKGVGPAVAQRVTPKAQMKHAARCIGTRLWSLLIQLQYSAAVLPTS